MVDCRKYIHTSSQKFHKLRCGPKDTWQAHQGSRALQTFVEVRGIVVRPKFKASVGVFHYHWGFSPYSN
jgi:hypothetical protein